MAKRLFVSVDLPDELADAVADVQAAFEDASGLNLTDPAQAHLTLKFLGDVEESRIPDLEAELAAAVDDAGVAPFTARFAGLGVFPSLDYISVVWLGVDEGRAELTRLHEAIEDRTTAMGFDAESHDFTPHVTLARMEHAGGKELVQDVVTGEADSAGAQSAEAQMAPDDERRRADPVVGETTVEAIRLTESTLTADGPEYSTVERLPLE